MDYLAETKDGRIIGRGKRARSCETIRTVSVCNTDKWNSYPDFPTPSHLFDSDHDMNAEESPTVVTEFTRVIMEDAHAKRRVEAYTSFPRTAVIPMSRSVVIRECDSQASASPANSAQISVSNLRSATTAIDYMPTPSVQEVTIATDRARLHPGWKSWAPYYRSDGPAIAPNQEGVIERRQGFAHLPPGISSDSSAPLPDNQTVTCAM